MESDTTQQNTGGEHKMPHNAAILIVAVIVIIATVVVATGFYAQNRITYTTETTVYDVLMAENKAFTEGAAYFGSRQYGLAKERYEAALAESVDARQKAQIQIKIAHTLDAMGEYSQAIAAYKAIAVDSANAGFPIVRAYAVQQLGFYLLDSVKSGYVAEIFSTEPFASLNSAEDRELTKRNIFAYASSIYPLAISEYMVATWHAGEARRLSSSTSAVDIATKNEHIALIKQKIVNAERELQRMENDENEQEFVAEAYKRRALLIGSLSRMGEATVADADAAYTKALNVYTARGGGADGYMRFFYAQFLANTPGRTEQMKRTLAPLYENPVYFNTSIATFFAGEKTNRLKQKAGIVQLAQEDGRFAEYLKSLGWEDSDLE